MLEISILSEIKGKLFGVIGLGRIGSRVAEIALGFGANVVYWSRNRKNEFEEKGIKYEDLDKLLSPSLLTKPVKIDKKLVIKIQKSQNYKEFVGRS